MKEDNLVQGIALLKELATKDTESSVRRAALDKLGKLTEAEEAEPLYEKVVDVLEPREMYYGSRYFFARHLASRANEVWRQRQPEKALVLFMRAKAEMAKCKAPFKEADPAVRLMIDKSIAFLQGANIQPDP